MIGSASLTSKVSIGGGLLAAAVALAACGSSGGGATATGSAPSAAGSAPATSAAASAPAAAGGGTAALNLASRGDLGQVLVDAEGHTLYLFEADTGGSSTCSGACATAWPPAAATGTPTVGPGLNQSLVGTVTRADGTAELTYNRHPLYRFAGDTASSDARGQGIKGFGAEWYVVNASGQKVDEDDQSAAPAATSGDDNYHY